MPGPVYPLAALLFAAATVASPALSLAADASNAANLSTQQQSRSIAIQNWSGKEITRAVVKTTDGREWNLGRGSASNNYASEIIVPAKDCIASVSVDLAGGLKLQANHLNACRNTQIVVREDRITIPEQAVPGGQQHGTPG